MDKLKELGSSKERLRILRFWNYKDMYNFLRVDED